MYFIFIFIRQQQRHKSFIFKKMLSNSIRYILFGKNNVTINECYGIDNSDRKILCKPKLLKRKRNQLQSFDYSI